MDEPELDQLRRDRDQAWERAAEMEGRNDRLALDVQRIAGDVESLRAQLAGSERERRALYQSLLDERTKRAEQDRAVAEAVTGLLSALTGVAMPLAHRPTVRAAIEKLRRAVHGPVQRIETDQGPFYTRVDTL